MTVSNKASVPVPRAAPDEPVHWLRKPATIRVLWVIGCVVLAVTLFVQRWVPLHGHFGWDDWYGFYAAFGFVGCVLMVVAAKVLALWVKRPDTYYQAPGKQREQGIHE